MAEIDVVFMVHISPDEGRDWILARRKYTQYQYDLKDIQEKIKKEFPNNAFDITDIKITINNEV